MEISKAVSILRQAILDMRGRGKGLQLHSKKMIAMYLAKMGIIWNALHSI